jgi:hypothetical protein
MMNLASIRWSTLFNSIEMKQKKAHNLSQIKTVEDLQLLKLEKRFHLEMKRMEFRFQVLKLADVVNPENIKNEIFTEGKKYLMSWVADYAPSFVWKLFSK